ncbi:MAG: SsrA-binding protein SmpB [Deltaproteobacteria bacterium]|nr:SsrA-binding protein SmpB [Deltaproteobacteria bacterium]
MAPPGSSLAQNRRATYNYEILDRFEAGLVLAGSEVKAIRDRKVSLAESFAQFRGDELFLMSMHVGEFPQAHKRNHEPLRPRKMLLHRRQLDKLYGEVQNTGMALLCLQLYLKDGRIKAELGLGRGKKLHDKRASIKERDQKREVQRALREHN